MSRALLLVPARDSIKQRGRHRERMLTERRRLDDLEANICAGATMDEGEDVRIEEAHAGSAALHRSSLT